MSVAEYLSSPADQWVIFLSVRRNANKVFLFNISIFHFIMDIYISARKLITGNCGFVGSIALRASSCATKTHVELAGGITPSLDYYELPYDTNFQ